MTLTMRKTVEIDDKLFLKAAREEYAEIEQAMIETGEIDRGAFVTLDEVFVRMYDNGELLLEVESQDIDVEGGMRDVDVKTGELR